MWDLLHVCMLCQLEKTCQCVHVKVSIGQNGENLLVGFVICRPHPGRLFVWLLE